MIVVTTPTGQIGSRLVRRLLDQDEKVRVIVRDAARLDHTVRRRVESIEGSHDDPVVLDKALTGAKALFLLVPPNPQAPSAEEHYLDFARAGAAAVARHGVGHVIGVSSAGHGWPAPAGVLSAAFAMDEELGRSGAAYRALCMPFYMENLLGQLDAIRGHGAFSLTCAGDLPLALIATRDIAGTAARLLTDLSWTGQENLPVFGPDRLTPDGMAEVIGRELGRPVTYRRMSMDAYASLLRSRGAGDQTVKDLTEAFTAQDHGIYDADWATAEPTPTDFRTWCREVLKPAVDARTS
ncbi:NmrA family transcriptional regulator [Sphaerisporangium melleum]|uniref:NmrA family transcriptional regulator n=1 Tax=Sphaerisporangium melleum TaxID=321316 RepID=A0A917RNQ9_9ACTN|nr:NAD(P)H-binding protein [Sphaerisporangium melleum]GGL15877.1 NmrA family transcriptional regulator [Sphaerisporangium melleum]GII69633.1 NmrA family transcriptional regulator [Sphaerisporangium melleum]